MKSLENLAAKPPRFPTQRDAEDIKALAAAVFRAVSRTLHKPVPNIQAAGYLDRQAKVDTEGGWAGVNRAATRGVTYADLLYERYLGRPFAYVQDALSEKKGGLLEKSVAAVLGEHGVPFWATRTREKIRDFAQAPDFLVPGKEAPECVIESKLTEDGGTARDKAARIFKLGEECRKRGITLVAFVDGKGFERINDVLAPILRWTRGWTFCLQTVERLIEVPAIAKYVRK